MLARPMRMTLNGQRWHMPVTEQPIHGSTEIWELVNLTDEFAPHPPPPRALPDPRPPELRSVSLRLRAEDCLHRSGHPGRARGGGWKDTVRAHGNMVTRIVVPFEGYTGRYMWHCHILEHADNEIMRPFEVLPGGNGVRQV